MRGNSGVVYRRGGARRAVGNKVEGARVVFVVGWQRARVVRRDRVAVGTAIVTRALVRGQKLIVPAVMSGSVFVRVATGEPCVVNAAVGTLDAAEA